MRAAAVRRRRAPARSKRPSPLSLIVGLVAARPVPAVSTGVSLVAVAVGCFSLSLNSLDALGIALLLLVGVCSLGLVLYVHRATGDWDRRVLGVGVLCLGALLLSLLVPEYLSGFNINGAMHRSLVVAVLLFLVGVPSACLSLYHLLGSTPRAEDLSYYPLILLPVLLILGAYGVLLLKVFAEGAPHLDWEVISTPYTVVIPTAEVSGDGSQATFVAHRYIPGLRDHILGTFVLMALTLLVALPIGVGTGVFLSEYSQGVLERVVRFATTSLRAISVFILGITALSLVRYSDGTFLEDVLRGFYFDINGIKHQGNGCYITGALVLSLLIIPIIARVTEEGCRSLPHGLREGSLALGATEGYTLLRLTLPWSLPNILTGALLGCAEAAGTVAVILFIASIGLHGVSPFSDATSLAYVVFAVRYGPKHFRDVMRDYEFTAALLLILITIGMTLGSLALKRAFAKRYRGE